MTYRDDHDATVARSEALQAEVAELKAERDRLQAELDAKQVDLEAPAPALAPAPPPLDVPAASTRVRHRTQLDDAAATERALPRTSNRSANRRKYFESSITPLATAKSALAPRWIPMVVLGAMSGYAVVRLASDGEAAAALSVVGAWVLYLACNALLALLVRRAISAERAWLAALPFEVTGFEDILADFPGYNSPILKLFLDPLPSQPIAELLDTDGMQWSYDSKTTTYQRRGFFFARRPEHNRSVRDWFHLLADGPLRLLHQRHALTKVFVYNETSGP